MIQKLCTDGWIRRLPYNLVCCGGGMSVAMKAEKVFC
jgi:hypothetical protein